MIAEQQYTIVQQNEAEFEVSREHAAYSNEHINQDNQESSEGKKPAKPDAQQHSAYYRKKLSLVTPSHKYSYDHAKTVNCPTTISYKDCRGTVYLEDFKVYSQNAYIENYKELIHKIPEAILADPKQQDLDAPFSIVKIEIAIKEHRDETDNDADKDVERSRGKEVIKPRDCFSKKTKITFAKKRK